jgi:lipopolysaccharide assembly protein B
VELESWWTWGLVLLPLFFGLGWMAARIDIKQIVSESRALPRSYFKGLNFLLNEQPDKAIEAFIEVVKVDPETIELHFALGSLFRRRGEFDRAIRMHQNLLERPDLAAEQKLAALAELGEDYLKAGILDRAEECFRRLEKSDPSPRAKAHLLQIYEQEKEWGKAIEMTKEVESEPRSLAQYHCELAASEAAQSRPDAARRHLEQALEANRKCVRASLLLGDLERAEGRFEQAIAQWKRIESQNPAYLALAAQRLAETHREAGRDEEGLRLLEDYLQRYPSLDLLDTVFQQTLDAKGAEQAYKLVRDEVRRNPTLLGLDRLLEAQIIGASNPERRRDLELVRNLVHGHTRRLARYRCEGCGFKARQFHWRCPACGGWETYPPRRTEEFDLAP